MKLIARGYDEYGKPKEEQWEVGKTAAIEILRCWYTSPELERQINKAFDEEFPEEGPW